MGSEYPLDIAVVRCRPTIRCRRDGPDGLRPKLIRWSDTHLVRQPTVQEVEGHLTFKRRGI